MKKTILMMTAFLCSAVTVFAADSIKVIVNEVPLTFQGQPPMIWEGRTLVPLRGIFEALGAEVTWIEESQTVIAQKGKEVVSMAVGKKEIVKGSTPSTLEVAPQLINGSVMIPARAAAEAFGEQVEWDEKSQTVIIGSGAKKEQPASPIPEETKQETAAVEKPVIQETAAVENPATKPQENDKIGSRTITEELKADNGTLLMRVQMTYPQFENPGNKTELIQRNRQLKQEAEEKVKNFLHLTDKEEKELKDKGKKSGFMPYELKQSYEITYQKNDIVSIVILEQIYKGASEQTTEQHSMTYNVADGTKIELSDLFTDTKSEIEQVIKQAFEAMFEEKPKAFLSNPTKRLQNHIDEVDFYLKDNAVCFYINPETVAPYEAGIVGFAVDWKG